MAEPAGVYNHALDRALPADPAYKYMVADLNYKPALHDGPEFPQQETERTLILTETDFEDLKIFLARYDNGMVPRQLPPNDNKHSIYFAELGLYLYITPGEFADISNHIVNNYSQTPINLNTYQVYYAEHPFTRFSDESTIPERQDRVADIRRIMGEGKLFGNYPVIYSSYDGTNTTLSSNYYGLPPLDDILQAMERDTAAYFPLYIINYDMSENAIDWGKEPQTIFRVISRNNFREVVHSNPPVHGELLIAYLVRLRRLGLDPRWESCVAVQIKRIIGPRRLFVCSSGNKRYFMYIA